jgi:hypothetical protein
MAENIDFRVKNGLAVSTTATIESTLDSISTDTGALIVAGGAGIAKNLNVGGTFSGTDVIATGIVEVRSDTISTTSTNGALTVAGGVGILGNVNLATTLTVGGVVNINSIEPATSPNTGSLTVGGGVGVAGDLWVGGTLFGTVLGSISTATNLNNGTVGQVPYQVSPGVTDFYGPGTAGQFLQSNGASAPSYVNTGSIYVAYSVTATNLNNGSAGAIPYQQLENNTVFLNIGTAGQLLVVNSAGSAPEWINTGSTIVAFANTATNASKISTIASVGATDHYITFVDSNNASVDFETLFTTSSIVVNPASGFVGIGGASQAPYRLYVNGSSRFTGQVYASATTPATNTATGALLVTGGAAIGNNLVVGSTASILSTIASTTTVAGNALTVAGGVGIGKSLYVSGPALFQDNVTFAGTTTNVFSTNTVYTDNFIDLHFPSDGGPAGIWTVDDGKDIGHIYHHYKDDTGDEHGALIWHNASDELRWYMGDVEYVGGSQTYNFSTGTYGKFRTGSIVLEHTATSISTSTGALIVAGGAGIAGDLWVGGVIYGDASISGSISTATNLFGGVAGQIPYQFSTGDTEFFGPGSTGTIIVGNGANAPTFVSTTSLYVGYAITATHLSAGTVGQIPFQTAAGRSSFFGAGDTGQLLVSAGASATGPVFTNTGSIYVGFANIADKVSTIAQTANSSYFLTFVDSNNANSVEELIYTTSSFVVNPSTGNVGVGTDTLTTKLTVVGGVSISGVTTVTNTTNALSTLTGALVVTGGAGIGGNLYVGQSVLVSNNATITGDVAVNGGDLTSTAASFNLLNTGVTTLNLAGVATAITIGAATGYTQIRNLTTITNATNATSTTTGALRVAGGVGVQGDLWARNIYSNGGLVGESASTATHIAGGTAGQVPYQTAPGRTSFYGPGTAGQILVSAGTSAPVYTNTSSIFVGNATTVTNLRAGAAGSLPYQSAANITTFLGISTSGYILSSSGSVPVWTAVGDLSAGSADKIKTVSTAGASINFLTFVDSNNTNGLAEDLFTTSSFVIRPSTGFVGLGTITPITNFDLVGGARISGVTTVTNATASSSITTGALQVAGGVGIGGNTYVGGNIVVTGDAAVNGGDITSTAATFNLLNATVTTANVLGAGTAITIGAATGFTNIRNLTTLTNTTISTNTTTGALRVAGGIGVGDSIYVKNRVGFVNASNVSRVYQVYNSVTDSLDTVFA